MAIEIERKFLVRNEDWRRQVVGVKRIVQAYLSGQNEASVRIRIWDDQKAAITIKSKGARLSRHEFEYPIPVEDARALCALRVGCLLVKRRHIVPVGGLTWEIDVFEEENAGLVVAEVELEHEQQNIALPSWVGPEITRDARYGNSRLAIAPCRGMEASGLPAGMASAS